MPNPFRETKFPGANEDREKNIFPVQLTTSRIGNLNRLILLLLYAMTIHTLNVRNNSFLPWWGMFRRSRCVQLFL